MSAETKDYSLIQDEDVLKRMWQDTEDFGRKKDIRAHMYKIREARLRDFYNTGEVTSSTTIKTSKSTSKGSEMTHADSLADHSFLSLKSKEIRDSESPTRDAYKITGVTRSQDHGWDIIESNESSNDGKSRSTSRVATTAGKQQIQGGEANFAAKAEQKTSVYQDGDDKNFVKSVGTSSQNVVKQEAHGGDENSKFYSSSTTTSSSSKYSSEQKSSTGDVDVQSAPSKTVVRTYTENIPNDLKNNSNFIDGKTKVTTETKTLPDGSTVTTTRYETIGSKSYATSSSSKQTEQRSSESHHDSRRSSIHDDVKITKTPRIEVCNDQSSFTIVKNQDISRQNKFDDVEARRVQDSKIFDRNSSDVKIAEVTISKEVKPTVDESTITRTVTKTVHTYDDRNSQPSVVDEKTTVTKTITVDEQPSSRTTKTVHTYDDRKAQPSVVDEKTTVTKTITVDEQPTCRTTKTINYIEQPTETINTKYTTHKISSDNFINTEREKLVEASEPSKPRREPQAEPKYETPERRQPIRPGKSEMDDTRSPLDGQYDTTYRTEFIPRRISVEVSPTHDAFARSLRSVSPVSSRAGSIRSLRTPSQASLRSSPEKFRTSPDHSKSPKRIPDGYKKSPERFDTIRTEVDSSTLTRKGRKPSRSPSPTTTASEIEFMTSVDTEDAKTIFKNQKITRRHTEDNVTDKRPTSLDVTTTTTTRKKKITERSPTSPLTDFSPRRPSPTKETKRRDSIKEQDVKSKKVLRRTDTYEERCKQILGIAEGQSTPRKPSLPDVARGKTPSKQPEKVQEFPSQIRKSPQKEPLGPYPEKKTPEKFGPKVQEFPSQIRKSPQKEPLEPYPQKSRKQSNPPNLNEFPSQIRKSPEKPLCVLSPEKEKTPKYTSKIDEFPSQARKSPEKLPLEPYPEKERTPKYTSKIDEFPSQTRKSPEKEPLEPYPEKSKPRSVGPKINEFPSQIRKSPGKEPLEPYPEKEKPAKYTSKINEFPSQTIRSPEKQPLEPYPEKERTPKYTCKIDEFPSQTRMSPEKQPLEPYPEKSKPKSTAPKINEFPSQIQKSREREPLEPYPEKERTPKYTSKIKEFPSQTIRSPEKEPLEQYPEKSKPKSSGPKINEFPSQVRKSPEKEPLEPYPEKERTPKYTSKINEFPSQTIKSSEKQPLEPYPEKSKPKSAAPQINEFPSQIPKSVDREPLEPYPEKERTPKYTSKIDEFPSQTRRSPERPQSRGSPYESSDFPSYRGKDKSPSPFRELRKSQDRVSLDDLPNMVTDRRSMDRVSLSDLETTKHDTEVDFIRREKYDTDITLRKSKRTKSTKVSKIENGDDSSSTSEDEEETTITEVTNITTGDTERKTVQKKTEKGHTVTKTTTTKECQRSKPKGTKTEVVRKSPVTKKPKNEPVTTTEDEEETTTTEVIDITVVPSKTTKSKIQQTYKTTAIKDIRKVAPKPTTHKTEVVTVKKTFVTNAKKPAQEAPLVKKFIPTLCTKETRKTEKLLTLSPKEVTPHKIVKKDNPEKTLPKKPSEKLVKPNTGRFSGVTEYTDQYSKTTKVTHTPKVTTKITITPTIKQEDVTKTTKVETTKKTGRLLFNGDEKRTTTQTTRKVAPTKPDTSRHVVSAIINIKPKQKPTAPITKTVHKTTATKIVTNNKQKPIKTPKKLQNGHIPSDEEETDQEELIEKNKKSVKLEKKCIATKSILIENAVADQREIIVDLKRSKSSREGTPDRLCPYPVRPDDDSGVPRYPDNIVEPDEPRQRIKTVTNDIIHEDIEGISSTITEIKDESLLTVNEKVSKFLTTAEEITKKPKDFKPAPKVERPILDIDDELREDECLLSVSDKVSKFITTADQLTKTKQTTTRPKPVQIEDADANVDENDESLLSVSEKVSHFIATAEKVKETPKAKPRSKEPSRSPSPRKEVESPKKSPSRDSPKRSEICSRRLSEARRDSFDLETTPKSSRRTSKDEPRMALSPTERLRSTETIKKAKALFENISKEQEVSKQRDIVSRPSVFEGRRLKEQKEEPELRHRSRSPGDEEIPHYMTPLDRTVKEHQPRRVKTDEDSETEDEDYPHSSPDYGDLPHYMLPLDRSLREKSPHKESVKQIEDIMLRSTSSAQNEEVDTKTTKFGVQLRRTDSDRRSSLTQKQVTTKVETHDELNIEEIFDLEYLESLLETIVGYDIRRRIRAQIRIVKKMIEESKLEIVTTKSRSPVREIKETEQIRRGSSEYKSSYSSYSERRSSETKSTKTTTRESSPLARDKSPERKAKSPERKAKSPERTAKSPVRTPKSPERKPKSPERKTQSPDRKTSKTETTKVFQTELKKTKPATRKVFDEKPEWITRTTLKKVTDTPVKNTVVTTTTKTTTSRRVQKSPSKERAPTDVITSSYGVGPMDENGAPLFGLRALKAQNKSEKTKVQGTVIQSRYYSENGNEPVGEISVTKYSTDPKDLPISDSKKEKGVSSVTTTQKFGYKGTPSLKSITSKTKGIESGNTTTSTKTSKVTRRGSVKEISQKFIENAVDSLKNERQSSYPKAGLILRTSSFKDTDESPTSREGSPGYEETRRTVTTVKTSSTSGGKVDTFLTNKSRVTGVQDVITRMKNEETEGETAEDIEAKNLLNKFIGSQVLLSGIESSNKASGGRSSITKVTTTTTTSESGKPTKTVTKTFTHPITPELLKTVWDEQTLNLLLEQSSNNEDKRIIRTRLREVMAEQEACADLVEKASEEVTRQESKSSIHGESLLPLLQGLLDQPDADQPADSGTESGEDLRSGLILEVQSALDKLSASLRSSATNISTERRDSLLQLVSRLQSGLSTQITPSPSSERRSSLQARFSKRKQRQTRHTVGVTTEELEDARKLMEEIAFKEHIAIEGPELQKEDSAASILSSTGSYKSQTNQVKNTTAKPFMTSSSTSQSHSGTSSTAETPTETSESLEFPIPKSPEIDQKPKSDQKQPVFNHSVSNDAYQSKVTKQRPLSQAVSLDCSQGIDLISVQKAVTQAATIKQLTQIKSDVSESDDDPSTVKQVLKEPEPPVKQPQPDLILQTNPIYSQPDESDDEFSAQYNEKANRFNTKKLKMKRANTIDIPKPLKYYEYDDDESENEELAQRRNSYLALRGPIRVGKLNVDKKVPEFEPKTESDKKFVAFLNKHTDNNAGKVAPWSNQNKRASAFGSIKSTFEKFQSPNVNNNLNSARNFWKSTDDAMTAGRVTHTGPKISKQSARNLQQMFEEKQKQNQYNNTNVVTGSLKVDTKSLEGKKSVKIVTQPNLINQFSHAPMSAFKPVRKFEPIQPQPISNVSKIQVKSNDPSSPMYLYSPKPFSPNNETPSPINHTPWLARSGESRVLSIAASKFEKPLKEVLPQRRPSKDKIAIPPGLQRQEKLSSPGMVKSLNQNTSVRKLSGQFEGLNVDYDTTPSRVFVPGENYTIQYDNKPKVYNAEYTITQRINLPPVVEDVKQDDMYINQHNAYQKSLNKEHQFQRQPSMGGYKQQDYKQPDYKQPDYMQPDYRQPDYKQQDYRQPDYKQPDYKQPDYKQQNYKQQDYKQQDYNQPKVFQPPPTFEVDQQFTSSYQFKPKSPVKTEIEDEYISYEPKTEVPQGKLAYNRQTTQENLQEYTAVSSKVMKKPISQQAVTVQNAPKNRNQHDFERAFNLKATLQKFNQLEQNHPKPLSSQSFKVRPTVNKLPQQKSLPEQNGVPKMVVYNNVGSSRPVFCVNDKPLSLESLEINERGESVLTGKFSIPALSKSESWHQICQGKESVTNKPSPRASPNSRTVTRSKSSHTLALPKQYEAGMSKQEMAEKQRTIEAYFGGKKATTADVKKTTINRVKTSQKISTQRQNSSGLSRSKTLPDIVCLDRLDDSNIDEVFEEIFKSKKSFTEGPFTTTSQVTTRVTQQKVVPKPMSPFAKFRQLDKQNSLNSPPSTPKTPTGSGSMFKFTDPSLNQSANTVKQRLLQWCQMRTHGYENIQLDNFSTSWADGMAFCALIHRFVPDAFDYNALNPKNRRHNFTLAFKVAEDKAGIYPLLDVDDMVALSKPDWKCIFTYVQSIYRRFKDED